MQRHRNCKRFGQRQLSRYEAVIGKGLEMIGDAPERGGSLERSEIRADIRLFHLELAAGRRGGASHCLYYTTGQVSNGVVGTIVRRLLGEDMEPRYRMVRALKQFTTAQNDARHRPRRRRRRAGVSGPALPSRVAAAPGRTVSPRTAARRNFPPG